MADTGMVPVAVRPHVEQVLAVTDAVCHEHLDAEYADLCARVVGKLARKRPSPLVRGDLGIWAAGVVHAVGQVNFLFDRSQDLHTTTDELAQWFGIKKTTVANKAKAIRDLLKLDKYDPEYMRHQLVDRYAPVWLIEINGFIVDARTLPLEIQEMAFRQGAIPYVRA